MDNDKIQGPNVNAAHSSFPKRQKRQRPARKGDTSAAYAAKTDAKIDAAIDSGVPTRQAVELGDANPDVTIRHEPPAYRADYSKDFPFQQNHAVSASRLAAQVEQSMELKGHKESQASEAEDQAFWDENLIDEEVRRVFKERIWLWEGLVPADEVTLVTGPGGCGKTSGFLKLAGAAKRRDPELAGALLDPGIEPVVIVTVGEQSEAQLMELSILAGAGRRDDDGGFFAAYRQVQPPALGRDMFWDAMNRARQKWPSSLFIIDSATSALRSKTDCADSVRETYGHLREVGGAWAVLHHHNKDKDRAVDSVDRVRGTTAWVDGCDRLIMATPQFEAVKFVASRRGDERTVIVPLPWQKKHPEKDAKAVGRPSSQRKDCKRWLDDNRDFAIEATGQQAFDRYEEDGGEASRRTFFNARKDWDSGTSDE